MNKKDFTYSMPMNINTIRVYTWLRMTYSVCPRCGIDIEYDFQTHCGTCGQALSWNPPENIRVIYK